MLKYRKFMNLENIRNFCIIAHIDHGKSTLADRMMEITGTVQKRDMKSQLLDSMELILVVDASQGIQAQTLANVYLAMAADLKIIPVLNKIDLPAADIPRVSKEVINLLGCEENEILHIAAKTGMGVEDVLNAVIERIPAPKEVE